MPRAGWVKPESDRRLSDLVSVGVLTRVFPPDLVDEVIASAGRTEQRNRSLPARVMAYFSIGMALYSEGSYEDVLAQLTDGLSWASGWQESYNPPSKSAIFQARARLGADAVGGVVRAGRRADWRRSAPRVCGWPDAGWSRSTAPAWTWRTRVVNAEHFGRPGVNKGEQAAFPQARVVALAECGTHAMFAANIGTYTESEATLTEVAAGSAGAGDAAHRRPWLLLLRPVAQSDCVPAPTCCGGSVPTRLARNRRTYKICPTARGSLSCAAPHRPRRVGKSRCWSASSTTRSTTDRDNPTGYRLFTTLTRP